MVIAHEVKTIHVKPIKHAPVGNQSPTTFRSSRTGNSRTSLCHPSCPHPFCPPSALSSACSPQGRLAPGRSWMRTMGTSTASCLLQSELKIPAFLCGVCGRKALPWGTEHWQVFKCSLMSPPPVAQRGHSGVLEALYPQLDCMSCILDFEVSHGLTGRA